VVGIGFMIPILLISFNWVHVALYGDGRFAAFRNHVKNVSGETLMYTVISLPHLIG
jgi:hypothetical protein